MHTLDLGAVEQNIARQALQAGAPLPDRIKNAPELKLGLELYLNAFFDLDAERPSSFDIGSIPWSKMKDYACFYDFDEDQTEDLIFFIKRMDAAYIKRQKAKQKA